MRSELEPLIGKAVVVEGHLASYKHVRDETWMCFERVVVRAVDPHKNGKQIFRQKGLTTDHMWVIGYESETCKMPKNALMKKVVAFGYINSYWRQDGSSDLGLKWLPAPMDVKEMIEDARKTHDWKLVIEHVDAMFASRCAEIAFDDKHSPRQVQSILRSYKTEAERQLIKTDQYRTDLINRLMPGISAKMWAE